MARTRQKAKQRQAKRREEERKAQGTTGPKPPSNPAEQAAVDQAEAYELGDVLEESGGDVEEATERLEAEPSDEAITPVEAPEPEEAPPARSAPEAPAPKERKPAREGREAATAAPQSAPRPPVSNALSGGASRGSAVV